MDRNAGPQTWADITTPKQEGADNSAKYAGSSGQQTRSHFDIADAQRPPPSPKELSTLQAEFARRGYALYPLGEHELYVTRWSLGRVLANLDAARRFLVQIGGAA